MAGRRHWFYVFDMVARKVTRINEIKGCVIVTHPFVHCIYLSIHLSVYLCVHPFIHSFIFR